MKKNPYRFWLITLHGENAKHSERFHGRLDHALAQADEMECEVDFDVIKVEVILANV
jgi:hypothetical protein